MVKLASARENRMYGPRLSRNRSEYTNAGIFVFATILLLSGLAAQLSHEPKSGIVVMLIALVLLTLVNLHDLFAHLAAIDYRFSLMASDLQLALVEFAVPVVQILGNILHFLGFFFLLLQVEKGYSYFRLENHALNMLIAGAILWLLGSIHNSCQIYERADGDVQILQESVHIPFLMGSLLFLVGAVLNRREQAAGHVHHGLDLLGSTYIWLGTTGSVLFFIGGINNVTKVFKMQQASGLRLEKLRGGAQDQLIQIQEGQMPLIMDDSRMRKKEPSEEGGEEERPAIAPTPFKDILVGQA